jgi:hypothetical protein
MTEGPLAHGEDGKLVGCTQFDYEAVEEGLFDYTPEELAEISQEDLDRAIKGMTVLLEWVFQNGMNNPEGLKIRSIIVCWVFLKQLRPLNETEMARGFGMKKQSLERWVEQFKKCFPTIKMPHFRPPK